MSKSQNDLESTEGNNTKDCESIPDLSQSQNGKDDETIQEYRRTLIGSFDLSALN